VVKFKKVPATDAVAAHPALPKYHIKSMSKNQYQGGHIQKKFRQLWQWLPILLS
jgi:hypothetical protein